MPNLVPLASGIQYIPEWNNGEVGKYEFYDMVSERLKAVPRFRHLVQVERRGIRVRLGLVKVVHAFEKMVIAKVRQ